MRSGSSSAAWRPSAPGQSRAYSVLRQVVSFWHSRQSFVLAPRSSKNTSASARKGQALGARVVAKKPQPSTLPVPPWAVSGFLFLAPRSGCWLTIFHGGLYPWPRRLGVPSLYSYGLSAVRYGEAFSLIMSIGLAPHEVGQVRDDKVAAFNPDRLGELTGSENLVRRAARDARVEKLGLLTPHQGGTERLRSADVPFIGGR